MKVVVIIARILLGLMFFFFGLNGFLHFLPMHPIPGDAGTYITVLARSHYLYLIAGAQVLGGFLLLTGQYVALGLALLAPVLANIITYHITLQHEGAGMGILAIALWLIVFWWHRAQFAPIFARKPAAG
jgi:putative oxidoreductase